MAKNAPNELKFWPDMYFYEFDQIPEDFWTIFKIGRFLAEKRSFRAFWASRFRNFFFDGNRIRAFKNAQIRLKISIYLLPIMCLTKVTYLYWIILSFGDFICVQSCGVGHFWSFLANFNENQPSRQLWTHIKSPKLKIIQQK